MAGSLNRGVIPNVNSPDIKTPTERELGFDRNSPGAFGALVRDPMGLVFAWAADQAAREATKRAYPGVIPSDNAADAFRHAAGSRLLSGTIGEKRAKLWGDAHEIEGIDPSLLARSMGLASTNTDGQRKMDLYNNRVGRALPSGTAEQIQKAIADEKLRKKPFKE